MLKMRYLNQEAEYDVSFSRLTDKIVQIVGEVPIKTDGFQLSRDSKEDWDNMDYSEYKTVYREIDTGVQFSCDGSVYVPPTPKVIFVSNGGGVLEGNTVQEVWNYEELEIPTPVANENYEFTGWVPEIPESGEVECVESVFAAVFTSTLPPEPEPQPDLTERVITLEEDVKKINEALGGVQ